MKKYFLIITFLTLFTSSYAQLKKGYAGFSLGPALSMGDYKSDLNMKTDVSASLEFGLRFTEHVGIAAKGYLIIAEQKESNYYSEAGSWEFQGLLAGPLISFALNDNIEWDLRPMIGFCTMADAAYAPIEIEDVASLALNLGTSFRFNIGGRVAIPINIDYFSTEIAATTLGYNRLEMNANYLNITTGIYIRFKG